MNEGYEKDLIYDVGLHDGEDSEFYLRKGFRVVAIEALPALAQKATERLRGYLDCGKLVILNVAVAEKDGPLAFFENPGNSVWGTAYPERAEGNQQLGYGSIKTTVCGMKFANILKQYGIPYYLKVDIEGADLLCLKALKNFESKPKHVSIESTKTSWKLLQEEFTLLNTLGYSKFKVVPQHTMTAQVCPFPAREGRYVDHHFEAGASGLFGEEAPGEWMDEAEAVRIYRSIFLRYKLLGAHGILRGAIPLPSHTAETGQQKPSLSRMVRRFMLAKRFIRRFVPSVGWYDTHAMLS